MNHCCSKKKIWERAWLECLEIEWRKYKGEGARFWAGEIMALAGITTYVLIHVFTYPYISVLCTGYNYVCI